MSQCGWIQLQDPRFMAILGSGKGTIQAQVVCPVASRSVGNFLQLCVDNRLPTLPQFTLSQPGIALCVPRMQPTTTRVLLQCGCHYNVGICTHGEYYVHVLRTSCLSTLMFTVRFASLKAFPNAIGWINSQLPYQS